MRVIAFIGFFLLTVAITSSCNSPYTVGKSGVILRLNSLLNNIKILISPAIPIRLNIPCMRK